MRPILLLFFIISALLPYPAAAAEVTITFADLNIIKGVNVIVYNATASGSFVGEYNSTETIKLDSTQNYVFVLKPTSQSWFTSPQGTVDVLGIYLPIYVNYLIAGVVVVGLAYAISRLWK